MKTSRSALLAAIAVLQLVSGAGADEVPAFPHEQQALLRTTEDRLIAVQHKLFAARQQGTQQRVTLAWQHACRAAARAGVDGTPAMTSREWATATAHKLPVAARPMASLAAVVDRVGYSRPDSIEPQRAQTYGRDCELWSDQVTRIATDTLSTNERLRQYFRDLN